MYLNNAVVYNKLYTCRKEKHVGNYFYTSNNKLPLFKVNERSLEGDALLKKIERPPISKILGG